MADVGMYASSPLLQPPHQNYYLLPYHTYAREGQSVKTFLIIFIETRSGRVQTRPVPENYHFGHLTKKLEIQIKII
jgi:hypothetical protein